MGGGVDDIEGACVDQLQEHVYSNSMEPAETALNGNLTFYVLVQHFGPLNLPSSVLSVGESCVLKEVDSGSSLL